MDERELIKGCVENNRSSQKALYDLLYGEVMGLSLRYANDDETAREVLQKAFLSIFKRIRHYKEAEQPFSDWIKKVVVEAAVHYIRSEDTGRKIVSTVYENKNTFDVDKEKPLSQEEQVARINHDSVVRALRKMTSGFRAVFNLHFVDGYSFEEIADVLSISEQTARTNYEKARYTFRNHLLQQ